MTPAEASKLRGLIAYHARCQWNMGATAGAGNDHQRAIIVREAEKARRAVYSYVMHLQRQQQQEGDTEK